MVSHVQVPLMPMEGDHFYRGEKEVVRAIVNKESMAFQWLRSCQERSLSSSCWAPFSSQGLRAPLSCLPAALN